MLVYLLTAVYRKGYVYRPVLDFKMPGLRMLLILLAPIILVSLIGNIDQIVDRNFASSLESGSISSLNYAAKIIGLITALVGTSVATVIYPRMSEIAAQGTEKDIRSYITAGFQKLVPLLLPAMAGIIILAKPLVRILFEHGVFTSDDTIRTAESLQMYAPLIIAASLNIILTRAFFSMRDTKTPAAISIICLAVSVGLKFLLIGPLAHRGLALSSSIVSILSMILLLFALRRRLGLLRLKRLGMEWLKIILATFVMSIAVLAGSFMMRINEGGFLRSVVSTGVLILLGIVIYVVTHMILRTIFIRDIFGLIRSFVKRSDVNTIVSTENPDNHKD
jgi:putative peptidoglycan lipid II flippase